MDTIAQSFPDVLWHAETPLLRTGPALMFHLAKVTRECGVKVVVAGDGADELFLGSDLFKEVSVRRFCLRRPESEARPLLFDRIRGSTAPESATTRSSWRSLLDAAQPDDPLFSHIPRFTSSHIEDVYSSEFKAGLGGADVIRELRASLPTRFFGWSSLNQAAYLEMTTRLSPDLLSSHDPETRERLAAQLGGLEAAEQREEAEKDMRFIEGRWRRDYPFLSRSAYLQLGPEIDPLGCADPPASGQVAEKNRWAGAGSTMLFSPKLTVMDRRPPYD